MGHLHISTVLLPQPTLSSCALQLEKVDLAFFLSTCYLVFILPVMHSSLFTRSLTLSLSCLLVKLHLSGWRIVCSCLCFVCCSFLQLVCCRRLSEPPFNSFSAAISALAATSLLPLLLALLPPLVGASWCCLLMLGACARSGPTWSARNQVFATWQRCPVAIILILDKAALLGAWQF